MSQARSDTETIQKSVQKDFENVPENWKLYDTVLLGNWTGFMNFNDGYFLDFQTIGQANAIPFFNVRNRNHGLAYNNQDTRDQTAWVFKIFGIGVTFFAPSVTLYRNAAGTPGGPQNTELHLWETELPKHASIVLQTNQDERLKMNCLMAPPGSGAVGGGVAQGNPDAVSQGLQPNVSKHNFTQGVPDLKNMWGFENPLEVPRRASLSATIRFSEYGRQLLQTMPGPFATCFRPSSGAGSWYFQSGLFGIKVVLSGQRQVQQRGQYHA